MPKTAVPKITGTLALNRSLHLVFAILGLTGNIMHKALILDKQAGTLALQICRALARRGYEVDILGIRASIAFSSRYCARALEQPSWNPEGIGQYLRRVFAADGYDAIYLCNEEVLAIIPSLPEVRAVQGAANARDANIKNLAK